jgi:Siphovirus Gp157
LKKSDCHRDALTSDDARQIAARAASPISRADQYGRLPLPSPSARKLSCRRAKYKSNLNFEGAADMASIAEANSLFEIDSELDALVEEIEQQIESEGQPSEDLEARFQEFCEARGEKVDRIGRFVRMMEAREEFCRSEAARLGDRARAAANKIERTKNMVLYYLLSRDLKKIEGQQFTLRAQKNSQDSVRIIDRTAVPKCYCRIEARISGVVWETVLSLLPGELAKAMESSIQETLPDNEAIKAATARCEVVPGAEVRRGSHLRVV